MEAIEIETAVSNSHSTNFIDSLMHSQRNVKSSIKQFLYLQRL